MSSARVPTFTATVPYPDAAAFRNLEEFLTQLSSLSFTCAIPESREEARAMANSAQPFALMPGWKMLRCDDYITRDPAKEAAVIVDEKGELRCGFDLSVDSKGEQHGMFHWSTEYPSHMHLCADFKDATTAVDEAGFRWKLAENPANIFADEYNNFIKAERKRYDDDRKDRVICGQRIYRSEHENSGEDSDLIKQELEKSIATRVKNSAATFQILQRLFGAMSAKQKAYLGLKACPKLDVAFEQVLLPRGALVYMPCTLPSYMFHMPVLESVLVS